MVIVVVEDGIVWKS